MFHVKELRHAAMSDGAAQILALKEYVAVLESDLQIATRLIESINNITQAVVDAREEATR